MRMLTLLAASLALAACSGPSAASPTPPAGTGAPPAAGSMAPPAGLDGRTFLSTGVTGRLLVEGSRISLVFRDGTLSVQAGCNQMSGPYALVDGRLQTGQMAMTEMACAEPLMAQDQWIAGFLPGAGVALDGATLVIGRDAVTLTFTDREVADPDRPLAGTRWVLEGIVSGDSLGSVPDGVVAALTFAEGTVAVESGCNRGPGKVEITDGTIRFGPIGLTKMGCPGSAGLVEAAVLAVIAGEVTYEIEADVLTISAGDRGLILRVAP